MRKILITGGASGLGKAITLTIANKIPDAKVFFTYNSSKESADKICSDLPNSVGIKCDFADASDIESVCSLIENNAFDVLINNAFVNLYKAHFHKISSLSFEDSFSKNVLPVIKLTQSFIAAARKKRFGKIITILSSYRHNSPPIGLSAYVAEKNYLYGLSKSWAVENATFNVTSNCISPGVMLTNLNANIDTRIIDELTARNPLKRLLTVEEVADVVYFLSTCSQQINGQDIVIDSSQTLH